MSGKRLDYISWDEYFMGVAILSGMRSKDPGTQVGVLFYYFVPKILSPASPSPGTIYPCSFKWLSKAPI